MSKKREFMIQYPTEEMTTLYYTLIHLLIYSGNIIWQMIRNAIMHAEIVACRSPFIQSNGLKKTEILASGISTN